MDPELVAALTEHADQLLAGLDDNPWEAVLAAEPAARPRRVSAPGLSQIVFGTPARPSPCTYPARRSAVASSSGKRMRSAAAAASSPTRRECPAIHGDFRSEKSPIADKTSSTSAAPRGVTTHQLLLAALKREWRTAQRSRLPCGVVMVDVLGLPALAHTGGQARAELLLRTLARRIGQASDDPGRPDLVGRVGEARFAVILPGYDDVLTQRFCDRLQHRLESGLGPAAGHVSVDTTTHDLAGAEDPAAVLRRGTAWDPPATRAAAR